MLYFTVNQGAGQAPYSYAQRCALYLTHAVFHCTFTVRLCGCYQLVGATLSEDRLCVRAVGPKAPVRPCTDERKNVRYTSHMLYYTVLLELQWLVASRDSDTRFVYMRRFAEALRKKDH